VEKRVRRGATVLGSKFRPAEHYVGVTRGSLRARLNRHNDGDIPSTARYRPWRVVAAFWFPDEAIAFAFERYLKSGSGRAFAKRHFAAVGSDRPS
jgi:predicted GIY-YIG superfamily endonuclease